MSAAAAKRTYTEIDFRQQAHGTLDARGPRKEEGACGPAALHTSLYAYIIGNLASMIANLDSSASRFQEKMRDVDDFMRYHSMPRDLRRKIHNYYDFLWARQKYQDHADLIKDLPQSLRVEISLHLNRDVIASVPLFHNCSQEIISCIVTMLKPEVYLPNQYIIREGEIGSSMYFISKGTVKVMVNHEEGA